MLVDEEVGMRLVHNSYFHDSMIIRRATEDVIDLIESIYKGDPGLEQRDVSNMLNCSDVFVVSSIQTYLRLVIDYQHSYNQQWNEIPLTVQELRQWESFMEEVMYDAQELDPYFTYKFYEEGF